MSPTALAKTKKTASSKKPRSHPTFAEMITEAIVSLKERTGSSQYAITKFIEEKWHKELPPTFRKLILHQLKKSVAADKLVKVKNSFKLATTRTTAPAKATTAPAKATAPAATKKTKAVSKPTAKASSKPKPKPKPKAATTKPKAAATKPKAKPKAKPAKPAAAKKTVAKPAKKVPVKGVKKPRSVKSPAKKAKK